jgi:hypothetical protein
LRFRIESAIHGIKECTTVLNKIADSLWEDIRSILVSIDRADTLQLLMFNIETIRREEKRWNKTIRAVTALHADKNMTIRSAAEHKFEYSAASMASRILIEMGLCECPTKGGLPPGELDITRMMALVGLLVQIGGWSDGINSGVINAELQITGLGLVLIEGAFYDQIIKPLGYEYEKQNLRSKANEYEEQLVPRPLGKPVSSILDKQFLDAWVAEYDFTVDQGQHYLDMIEEYGLNLRRAVISLTRSELYGMVSKECPGDAVKQIVDAMTLRPRSGWDDDEEGFNDKDYVPWRFRRRLSAIYRPMIQLDITDDPQYLISPEALRRGYISHGYGLSGRIRPVAF